MDVLQPSTPTTTPVNQPTAEEFAERITEALQSSVRGILEAGRLLVEAKEVLTHGIPLRKRSRGELRSMIQCCWKDR